MEGKNEPEERMFLMSLVEGLALPPRTASKYEATTFIFLPNQPTRDKEMMERRGLCYYCLTSHK